MTFVLGLTGGIASGKSTVSQYFKEKGVPVIDADDVSRQVVEPGTVGLERVVAVFGADVLQPDGRLNRKKLGSIVFNDKEKLNQLNRLLHREIRKKILAEIDHYKEKDTPFIVADIPLLFETDYEDYMSQVMTVFVPPAVQIERLMSRDQLTKSEAEHRMDTQLPLYIKAQLSDIVIDNSGTIEDTYRQIDRWLKEMTQKGFI